MMSCLEANPNESQQPLAVAPLSLLLSLPQQARAQSESQYSDQHSEYSEIDTLRTILAQPWPDTPLDEPLAAQLKAELASRTPEQPAFEISKSELKRFIAWALHQSYAPVLTPAEKLKLLDVAWAVQNLLWSLK